VILSAITITRITLLEALRSRLPLLMVMALLGLVGLAEFLGELSITEEAGIKASITASGLRLFSICLVCLCVISGGVRELHDKSLEMMLSLPLPRYVCLLGKLAGFAILALCIAVSAGLLLSGYAPATPVACWALSLLCEQLLMACFSFLCVLTFANVAWSALLIMAFYLLARSMETLQLLSASPLLTADGASHQVMYVLVNAVSLLLPDLHAFTRSDWLLYGIEWNEVAVVVTQTLIYLVVLTSAGLFDLYRKNF